jgi:hypothetical protein
LSLIVKNISSTIFADSLQNDVGLEIPVSSQEEIVPSEYVSWSQSSYGGDAETEITNGNLVINLNSTDLSATNALIVLRRFHGQLDIPSGLIVVETYGSLPSSPELNDQVFYLPFNTVLTWDGTHWVGPKRKKTLFGRDGIGTYDIWLKSVGNSDVWPKFRDGGIHPFGIYMPYIGDGCNYKLYNITAKTDYKFTGSLEIHESSPLYIPNYGSTGKAKIDFTNWYYGDIDLTTPIILNNHGRLQCFCRRTAGTWSDWNVTLTYAIVAAGAS